MKSKFDCRIVNGSCVTDHIGAIERGEVCSFCYQPGHVYEDHPQVKIADAVWFEKGVSFWMAPLMGRMRFAASSIREHSANDE